MIFPISDNIISPLGVTTAENWTAVKQGLSGVSDRRKTFGVADNFTASLLDRDSIHLVKGEYTLFETLLIRSAEDAINRSGIDPSGRNVAFIISTTKGNVELTGLIPDEEVMLWHSAVRISEYFGNKNRPTVVSNACISGGCAQYVAKKMLEDTSCGIDYAIAVGGDILSRFVVSGFQSFKALSDEKCRPFDAERKGLNLGEGAATIIFSRNPKESGIGVGLAGCAICNDANHITGPSRTGEGLHYSIEDAYREAAIPKSDTAFICAHGTSTLYNDEMESLAFTGSSLTEIPVTSLKPHFGHTLGGAGLLETIISTRSLSEKMIYPTLNHSQKGVSGDISVLTEWTTSGKRAFLKCLSGFGGSNIALIYTRI